MALSCSLTQGMGCTPKYFAGRPYPPIPANLPTFPPFKWPLNWDLPDEDLAQTWSLTRKTVRALRKKHRKAAPLWDANNEWRWADPIYKSAFFLERRARNQFARFVQRRPGVSAIPATGIINIEERRSAIQRTARSRYRFVESPGGEIRTALPAPRSRQRCFVREEGQFRFGGCGFKIPD